MARTKPAAAPVIGAANLRFRGFSGPVDFSFQGEPAGLKAGIARMRGFIAAPPPVAEEAFRAGEGALTLEGGAVLRLTFLGHTASDGKVYFEARV